MIIKLCIIGAFDLGPLAKKKKTGDASPDTRKIMKFNFMSSRRK